MGYRQTPKLDNARKLRDIYFYRSECLGVQVNHQKTQGRRRFRWKPLCNLKTTERPFKLRQIDSQSEGSNKIWKTKHACIVEAHESARKRLETTLPKDHEDHIAEQGFNSLSQHDLVHTCVLMPQAMKSPAAKAAVDKE